MRWAVAAVVSLALAGCSKAPDRGGPGEAASTASGVAFAYRYAFRLPSDRIAAAQEAHAQACERLGAGCRITGMSYTLDESGQVAASLDVRVAAAMARAFGRGGVRSIEAAGGTLTGAEITGTDAAAATEAAVADATAADADRAGIDRELARPDLAPAQRSDLLSRRADLLRASREGGAEAASGRASMATTPISFGYVAGLGVGLRARLAEAAHAGSLSLTWTLASALMLLAYFGPPLLLLLALALLWRQFGRHWWRRAFPNDGAA